MYLHHKHENFQIDEGQSYRLVKTESLWNISSKRYSGLLNNWQHTLGYWLSTELLHLKMIIFMYTSLVDMHL